MESESIQRRLNGSGLDRKTIVAVSALMLAFLRALIAVADGSATSEADVKAIIQE